MEIDQSLLMKVKNYLRRSHDKLDDDLSDNIAACVTDLKSYGVKVTGVEDVKAMDPLILNAIKLYCKSEDVDDPAKAAEYRQRYESLKACLGVAGEYKEAASDE